MEENQFEKIGSLARQTLTDHEFFIEILLLIPATWQSINNQLYSPELRMSDLEIFIRTIPKQLEIIAINFV